MKNFKKLLALVIAGAMTVGSMSMMAYADPEPATIVPEGLTADSAVTVKGLDTGDEVTLYKLVEWKNNAENTSAGWVLTDTFKDDADCQAVLTAINAVTTGVYSLTKDDVAKFTNVINGLSADEKAAIALTGAAVNNGASTTSVETGMYLALVKPAVAGTLYNPIIVSADYLQPDPETNVIDASKAELATGFAKKETLRVDKEQEDKNDTPPDGTNNSYNVGDTVSFTVKTTIPTFAEGYKDPKFKVTDSLSTGLVLTTGTVHVYNTDSNAEIATLTGVVDENGTSGWTLDVPSSYISALEAPQPITIKYDAVLTESAFTNVNEETNDVDVEFSNNPNDENDKGHVDDKTRTYTFSIDGKLLGLGGKDTSELVKVAVDGNGNPILQSTSTNTTYKHALEGAIFGLYTDSAATVPYVNGTNKDFENIRTDSDGFMEINGLEEGTYYLKELTAPSGFIKDQKIHTIEISANYGEETLTNDDGYEYKVPVLTDYTITIDGVGTSIYNMTLEESKITTSEIVEASNSLLNNTKGVELPSTGGVGTTLFYIIGAVLVLGAGVLLVTRRRVNAN